MHCTPSSCSHFRHLNSFERLHLHLHVTTWKAWPGVVALCNPASAGQTARRSLFVTAHRRAAPSLSVLRVHPGSGPAKEILASPGARQLVDLARNRQLSSTPLAAPFLSAVLLYLYLVDLEAESGPSGISRTCQRYVGMQKMQASYHLWTMAGDLGVRRAV